MGLMEGKIQNREATVNKRWLGKAQQNLIFTQITMVELSHLLQCSQCHDAHQALPSEKPTDTIFTEEQGKETGDNWAACLNPSLMQ